MEESMLKKSTNTAGVLGLTLALGLCTASLANAEAYTTPSSPYVTSSGAAVSDQDLIKSIGDKVGPGWLSRGYENVTVQVVDGNVTLLGTVKTAADKESVEKDVRNIEGVKSLNSQITVKEINTKDAQKREFPQDTYATAADDQLNKKIRDNVSTGWLWNSYKDVALNTSNGVVTLEGNVSDLKDQQTLMNEIQKIEGVRSVSSNLTIKNS